MKKGTKKIQKKNVGGRPTKLTEHFLKVAEEVLMDENLMLYTDQQWLEEINEKLPKVERIGKRTWLDWKADNLPKDIDDRGKGFRTLIKRALRHQKKILYVKFSTDEKAWTRWAWLIERKFDEWNMKHKADFTSKDAQIVGFNFVAPVQEKAK